MPRPYIHLSRARSVYDPPFSGSRGTRRVATHLHYSWVAISDHDEPLEIEEVSAADRPVTIPDELPILPLRDTVLFPNSFMPLAVARESSVRLIDDATSCGKVL